MTTDETHSLGACLKHWRLQKGLPLEVIALNTRVPLKYLRALETNDFSTLAPIEPVHHTLGESLRAYRDRQHLSLSIIAERTRVPLAALTALEENNVKNLPEAPVIIRAFVDAYLNCLTLQEGEKEFVLVQFAKMVDTVYAKPRHDSNDPSSSGSVQPARTPFKAWSNQLHNCALGVYVRLNNWRTTFCRSIVSTSQQSLACADRIFDRAGSVSAQASRTAVRESVAYAVALMARFQPEGGWSILWPRILNQLCTSIQQIWRAITSIYRNLAPLVQRSVVRHHLIEKTPSPDHPPAAAPPTERPLEGKPWLWFVQYGITVLLLLMLGSTASSIPLFKEAALADTKLTASNLVAFIGYGGALLMGWLMGRNAVMQLVRNGSGLAFLRPLGAPFNALLGLSASYKLLLTLVGPSLAKADRLAYNWIFVFLILAATLWLIRTWFLKSAPLLDSLDTTNHPNQSAGIAIASLRD